MSTHATLGLGAVEHFGVGMNWRRGLLRLWIVVSVIWAVLVVWLQGREWPREPDPEVIVATNQRELEDCTSDRTGALVGPDGQQLPFAERVSVCLDRVLDLTESRVRLGRFKFMVFICIVPVFLLICYFVIFWVVSGFRKRPTAIVPVLLGVSVFALADPAYARMVPQPAMSTGKLRICVMEEQEYADHKSPMHIPKGTAFHDLGVIDDPASATDPWALTVVTTQAATLKPKDKCMVVPAKVVTGEPSRMADRLGVRRSFRVADRRYFEILGPDDSDAPMPDLFPWNGNRPSLMATAATDFK